MWVSINKKGRCSIHSSEPFYNELHDIWQSTTKVDAPDGTFALFEEVTHAPITILVERINSNSKAIISERTKIF